MATATQSPKRKGPTADELRCLQAFMRLSDAVISGDVVQIIESREELLSLGFDVRPVYRSPQMGGKA